MVADLGQSKGKISGCFKNSASVVFQRSQNKVSFQRNGSSVVLKAVCHVPDWPQQVRAQQNRFLCEPVYLKQGRANRLEKGELIVYGRRKSED